MAQYRTTLTLQTRKMAKQVDYRPIYAKMPHVGGSEIRVPSLVALIKTRCEAVEPANPAQNARPNSDQ
jgi:hypothetical protein